MASNIDAASGSSALSPHPHNPTNTPVPTPTEGKGYKITNDEELRIVLVGKTGAGKSATGNTILGPKSFLSKLSSISLTVDCAKRKGMVDGQHVAIIDTPGLFDTRFDEEKTFKDIRQCISYASPGPHVFLVVIKLDRYTEEEKKTVQNIQEIFGQAADKYCMVLFTGGDNLDDEENSIHEFVMENPDLRELVDRCNGQYHVFNNRQKDRSQVTELLNKIRSIVEKNGGSHYTTEMFQEAEMIIEQEKERILKKKEEQIIKEKEELKKEIEEKMQKEIEKINEKHQLEKEREKREREEDKKREEQSRDEEREKERKEREKVKREMQRMEEDRKSEREERERERKEREEKQQRERENREAEEERKRKELEESIKKRYEEELKDKMNKLQTSYEEKAREEAEDSNLFVRALKKLVECIADTARAVGMQLLKKAGSFSGVIPSSGGLTTNEPSRSSHTQKYMKF